MDGGEGGSNCASRVGSRGRSKWSKFNISWRPTKYQVGRILRWVMWKLAGMGFLALCAGWHPSVTLLFQDLTFPLKRACPLCCHMDGTDNQGALARGQTWGTNSDLSSGKFYLEMSVTRNKNDCVITPKHKLWRDCPEVLPPWTPGLTSVLSFQSLIPQPFLLFPESSHIVP